ncbi:MAG: hypothetical protein IT357_06735 [Gemmatimonadaceae bacterium]|nr:hypothetical protein [Gemmatimonadaceae bacterium]
MTTSLRENHPSQPTWPIFAAALVLAVLGFWPSFFAVLSKTPLPHHIHGWSATAWMCLPLLQYALVRRMWKPALAILVAVTVLGIMIPVLVPGADSVGDVLGWSAA